MAKHLALCSNCGEILIVHVQAMVGGSVQENVGVSHIVMPEGLDEAGQQRFLASFRGDFGEAEYDAAVAAWETKWYPDRVSALVSGTGVVEIASLSVTPLQLALGKGADITLGSEPAAVPVGSPVASKATSQPVVAPTPKVSPQSVKLTAAAEVGATSLEVEKFTPTQHWPAGTSVNAKAAREAAAAKAKLILDVAKADAAVELAIAASAADKERADWEAAHPKPVTVEQALADKAKAEKALAAAVAPGDPTKLAPGEQWDATAGATAEAAKRGVDMAPVQGTGAGGTVTKADVIAHDTKEG